MAIATHESRFATSDRTHEDRPIGFSWGAIFGGAVAALAIWMLLYALGAAIGLSAVDPDNPNTLRGSGIFGGVWGIVAPLIALFCGGLVTGQAAGALARKGGAVHGLVTWALTTLFGAWLLFNLLGSIASGVAQVGSTAVEGAGGAEQAAQMLGIQAQDILAPINQRLEAEGRPTISPEELQAAVREAAQTAVRTGELDRQTLVQAIATRTQLSEADANELADRIETRAGQAGQDVGEAALTAVERTGHVFWGVFGALLLGMLACVGGAILGISPRMRAFHEPPRDYPGADLTTPPSETPRHVRGS